MEREALKRALAVMQINLTLLEKVDPYDDQEDLLSDSLDLTHKAIATVKEALEQPEQEPVGWMCSAFDGEPCEQTNHDECENPIPLCTLPPQPAQEPDAYQSGYHDGKKAARARCIELVLAGSSMPVQTRTLEALQRDRKRIAKLIEEDGKT